MNKPIMPMGTAVWLVDNTSLTFEQIADFVQMHVLEIKAVADGEIGASITGWDPLANGQLKGDEIQRCESDKDARLQLSAKIAMPKSIKRKKVRTYTPIVKRNNRIGAINWLLRNKQGLSEKKIAALLGASIATVQSVARGTHWNSAHVEARHPVESGVCTREDYDAVIHDFEKDNPPPPVISSGSPDEATNEAAPKKDPFHDAFAAASRRSSPPIPPSGSSPRSPGSSSRSSAAEIAAAFFNSPKPVDPPPVDPPPVDQHQVEQPPVDPSQVDPAQKEPAAKETDTAEEK